MAALPEDPDVANLVDAATDPSVVIISHAVEAANLRKLCVATIECFVSILGSEAGNLAVPK